MTWVGFCTSIPQQGVKYQLRLEKWEGGAIEISHVKFQTAKLMHSLGLNQRYCAAPVVFPGDFDGGEHVYRVHLIIVQLQLVTVSVIMPAKKEHRCDSGSESLDKHESRDILHFYVERRDQSFAVAERAER